MYAYKLFRVRKDGSLGPLFINAKQRVPMGEWLKAEAHRTNGFSYRPGWHCARFPYAPHLKQGTDRAWYLVKIADYQEHYRPEHQGGLWYTAQQLMVIHEAQDPLAESLWFVSEQLDGSCSFAEADGAVYFHIDGRKWHGECPLIERQDYYLRVGYDGSLDTVGPDDFDRAWRIADAHCR